MATTVSSRDLCMGLKISKQVNSHRCGRPGRREGCCLAFQVGILRPEEAKWLNWIGPSQKKEQAVRADCGASGSSLRVFPCLVSGRGHRPHPGSVIIQSSLEITRVRYFYPSLKKHGFHGAGSWYVGSRERKASKSWILRAITPTSHAREVAIVP